MNAFIFISLSSLFDRARGIKSYLTILPAFLFGLYIHMKVPEIGWWGVILIASAYILGEFSGWGNPVGAFLRDDNNMPINDAHWWQKGNYLRTNVLGALITRGVMWGLPLVIACIILNISIVPFLLFPVLFVGAYYIVLKLFEKDRPDKGSFIERDYKTLNKFFADRLGIKAEFIRGFMFALPFIYFY